MRDSAKVIWLSAALLLPGCSTKPDSVSGTETFSGLGDHPVFVVSHGWHTGIILPAYLLTTGNPQLKNRFADADFLEVGWGDEAFYQAEEITFDKAAGAALWPTNSVVHIVAVPNPPTSYFANSDISLLCATGKQAHALATFIENSFSRDPSGRIIQLQQGIYGDSQFFAGRGDFHLFSTCNKWTAKGLHSLGMEIDPTFQLTADSVMSYLAEHQGVSTKQPLHAACPGKEKRGGP